MPSKFDKDAYKKPVLPGIGGAANNPHMKPGAQLLLCPDCNCPLEIIPSFKIDFTLQLRKNQQAADYFDNKLGK